MLEALDKISAELKLTHDVLNLIAEIDEFKGKWQVFRTLSPERLSAKRSMQRGRVKQPARPRN